MRNHAAGANAPADIPRTEAPPPIDGMHAGWIDTGSAHLFACFHPARGTTRRPVGILLADPFGEERMRLHLTYREVALRLSAAGFPTLRIDPSGTCDSSGYPRQEPFVPAALAALDAGADFLRKEAAVAEIVIFGANLGGSLGCVVASKREDVTGLVLWGAPVRGKTYLRELEAAERFRAANREGKRPSTFREGDRESLGFLISDDGAKTMRSVDVPALSLARVRRAAAYGRNQALHAEAIEVALRDAGVEVHAPGALCNMDELVDDRARPPDALIEDVVRWCEGHAPAVSSTEEHAPEPASLSRIASVTSPTGRPAKEEVVRFGHDGGLFGILTTPPEGAARGKPAVLLVNSGGNHRVGVNRNYVEWARTWASEGTTVLRIDVRGMGDSPPMRPGELSVLYRPGAREDIRTAIDLLEEKVGARGAVCVGLCAGAYHAFHVACADDRVVGLVLLDPLRFRLADDQAGRRPIRSDVFRRGWRVYLEAVLSVGARPPAEPTRTEAAEVVLRTARAWALDRARALPWAAPVLPSTWLSRTMTSLTTRGCRVYVVITSDSGIERYLAQELLPAAQTLTESGCYVVETIDGSDHIVSPLWSQEWLAGRLGGFLRHEPR